MERRRALATAGAAAATFGFATVCLAAVGGANILGLSGDAPNVMTGVTEVEQIDRVVVVVSGSTTTVPDTAPLIVLPVPSPSPSPAASASPAPASRVVAPTPAPAQTAAPAPAAPPPTVKTTVPPAAPPTAPPTTAAATTTTATPAPITTRPPIPDDCREPEFRGGEWHCDD